MKNIILSFKSLFIGAAIAGICTTAAAISGQVCSKGGYIKRVTQGWPHDNSVIGITIRDENGNESNWTTSGSGDVGGHAWTRALHAMALTAYTNQAYVFPSVAHGNCSVTWKAADGKDWNARWEGLIIASGPGVY